MPKKDTADTEQRQAVWRINPWCRAMSCSRAQFYNLYALGGIEVTKVGRMTLVRTSPQEYLDWVEEQRRLAGAGRLQIGRLPAQRYPRAAE